jgi:FMN-dependent oxidoreductase (nitrilotriacetate monooxygenase family)
MDGFLPILLLEGDRCSALRSNELGVSGMTRQMKLGVSIRGLGYHGSAWRHPAVDPAAAESIGHYIALAQLAEAACLDLVFFADALAVRARDTPPGSAARYSGDAELDPSTILPALAVVTRHIGLISTASTTYNEPYHIARRYASLDHISAGRAGWNVVTSFSEREAQNFNSAEPPSKSLRYTRAREFLDVVVGLWDGWDADALVHDKAAGVFLDPAKVHALDHAGPHFQVRGPLTSSRTPQGRPLIVQAGASDSGLDLAGLYADLVYSIPLSMEAAIQGRRELRARAEKFGRSADAILSMPGIQIITGRTEAEARDRYQALLDLVDPLAAMMTLTRQFGPIVTPDMLDDPVPETADPGIYSVAAATVRTAREKGWTVRRLCQVVGMGQHFFVRGTADQVAETMAAWFEAGACDGFNILPAYSPGNLAEVTEHIVPRLQHRGLFRRQYAGRTLRENLGLPRIAAAPRRPPSHD